MSPFFSLGLHNNHWRYARLNVHAVLPDRAVVSSECARKRDGPGRAFFFQYYASEQSESGQNCSVGGKRLARQTVVSQRGSRRGCSRAVSCMGRKIPRDPGHRTQKRRPSRHRPRQARHKTGYHSYAAYVGASERKRVRTSTCLAEGTGMASSSRRKLSAVGVRQDGRSARSCDSRYGLGAWCVPGFELAENVTPTLFECLNHRLKLRSK